MSNDHPPAFTTYIEYFS